MTKAKETLTVLDTVEKLEVALMDNNVASDELAGLAEDLGIVLDSEDIAKWKEAKEEYNYQVMEIMEAIRRQRN